MIKQKLWLLGTALGLVSLATGQTSFGFTTREVRRQHDRRLVDSVIVTAMQQPLTPETEAQWRSAFWAMELMLYKTPQTYQQLKLAWRSAGQRSESFQRALLEVCYTLYPLAFEKEAALLLRTTASPAVFVRCAEYLLRTPGKAAWVQTSERLMREKFASRNFSGFPLLRLRLRKQQQPALHLPQLLHNDFLPGQTVIYSIQRRNRNYPGLVVIRRPDGGFVKNSDSSVFHVPQLARAITGYPYYITNGNTPQGIYRWTGFDTSRIDYIGPTPNLQMVMPYEAEAAIFLNDSTRKGQAWADTLYAALLPPAGRANAALWESYRAGQMGRTEIIMHGTTINPAYYKGQPYFPHTPSLGCLCSYEEWDNLGRRVKSDQQAIVDALKSSGASSGYVVVIDLDDKQAPVALSELPVHNKATRREWPVQK